MAFDTWDEGKPVHVPGTAATTGDLPGEGTESITRYLLLQVVHNGGP
jgi:hypothetical protein